MERLSAPRSGGRVYESGWQSWSPAGWYGLQQASPRPSSDRIATMSFRSGALAPAGCFQGEGLLVLELACGGPCVIWSAQDPTLEVPSIRLWPFGDQLVVEANGTVARDEWPGPGDSALQAICARLGSGGQRPGSRAPHAWCSWGFYRGKVTSADVVQNLKAAESLDLPIEVFLVDDGWQMEIGDWSGARPGFGDLQEMSREVLSSGRRLGLWLAPFLVGANSEVAKDHPDWLVPGLAHPRAWGQTMAVLDTTRAAAAAHLEAQIRRLADLGCSYFKLDFLYAATLPGRSRPSQGLLAQYREAMVMIAGAAGPGATILGCGAPLLPSIGLVDAMRVSPDIALHREPVKGDLSQPSLAAALRTGQARAAMQGRLWNNDPDMLIVRRRMPERDLWAAHVMAMGGVVTSGDRLADLDPHGVTLLRQALSRAEPSKPSQGGQPRAGLEPSGQADEARDLPGA